METILTLPLVLAVVLVELAVGGTFVAWFLERRGEAPGGFLKLVAGVDAFAAAAAVGLAPALPRGDAAARIGLDAGSLSSFGQALALVAILMIAQLFFAFVPAPVFRNVGAILAMSSEEHTSELQSQFHLVCRLMLAKKTNTENSAREQSMTTLITSSSILNSCP